MLIFRAWAACPQSPLHFPLLPQPRFSQIQPHILHTTLPTHVFINTARAFYSWGVNSILLSCKYHFWRKRYRFNFHYKKVHRSHGYCISFFFLIKDATKEHQNSTQNKDQNIYSMRDRHSKVWWKTFPGVWEARGVPLFSFTRGGLGPKFPYPTLSNACQEG